METIGPYEVLAKLAVGGVGEVYLARRGGPSGFRRLVAIKRLHPQFASDPGFVTMFRDEARLAARIHHANVVSIVELGEDDDGHYVVMDFVEGANLATLVHHAQGAIPRAIAVRIVLDALAGLAAAHDVEDDDGRRVDLVHRDVSPQNILVGTDGASRLGDFGIARASALRDFETRGATMKGKLEYMAPEQIDGKAVDRTTDLFATGIVLWELLTGQRLFPATSQVKTIQRICFDPIPSPRAHAPTLSPDLERVSLHALERANAQRYRTASAFAEDLERAARADCGIATQREVASFLAACLGDALPRVKTLLARSGPASGVPGPSTQQLPKSDWMVAVAPPSERGAPPPSGLDTKPYGNRVPREVIDEARRAAEPPRVATDPIGAPVARAPAPMLAQAPPAPPSSSGAIASSPHPPLSRPILTAPPSSARAAPTVASTHASWGPIGVLVALVLVVVGIAGAGLVRYTHLRPGHGPAGAVVSADPSPSTASPTTSTSATSEPLAEGTPPPALELPEAPIASTPTPHASAPPPRRPRIAAPAASTGATPPATPTATPTETPAPTPTPAEPPPGLPAEL